MLPDGVDNHLTQFVLPGNFNAVFDVGNQDQGGHGRGQLVVLVPAAPD
jgi:hypothetical protein